MDPGRIPVRELAASRPAAIAVLHRHRIDFCCRAERTLAEACAARTVPVDQVLGEISRAEAAPGEPTVDWRARSLHELVDHLDRYHARLEVLLADVAARLDQAMIECDRPRIEPLRYVRSVFNGLRAEMSAHLMKEEQIVFPLIRSGDGAATAAAMENMRREHDDTDAALSRLHALTDGFTAAADAGDAVGELYAALATLDRDLLEHMHLENNILFPRALSGEAPGR